MASSDIEVCNRALARIGVDQLIEDFSDPSNRARQCELAFEPCRDEVLQDFPWNFSQTCIALALAADVTIPGWTYAYLYPDDCLKVQAVSSADGVRAFRYYPYSYEIWNYTALLPQGMRMPYMRMAHPTIPNASILVTDQVEAYAWFTKKSQDISQWSPIARSALSWRIAVELALALKADARLSQNASAAYTSVVSQAQAASLNEERPDAQPQSAAILARL